MGPYRFAPPLVGSSSQFGPLLITLAIRSLRRLIDKAVGFYKEAGGTVVVEERTGGGTDAAYAALSGKPVIESMGLPGFGYHSDKAEYVIVDAIPRRLYMAARLIMDLGRGN